RGLEHVPQKWEPVLRIRTCSNKDIERDDDSKKSHSALWSKPIHLLRELDIALGNPAGIVGGKRNLDPVVHIEPFRVMVELFGDEGAPRHEAESFVEILEAEFLADGVPPFDLGPAFEPGKGGAARTAGQFFRHDRASLFPPAQWWLSPRSDARPRAAPHPSLPPHPARARSGPSS